MMISSIRVFSIALLVIASHMRLSHGFVARRAHHAQLQPRKSLFIHQQSWGDQASINNLHFAKNNNDDNDVEKNKQYTKIEDGSPLGVAIVLIGSLLIFSGDESAQAPTSSSVWIVFATASFAAGLARLIRYMKNKND